MESQRYHYCVSRLNDEYTGTMLMPGDILKFSIRVAFYSIDTNLSANEGSILYYSPSQCIPCYNFFQEGQNFLRTTLSGIIHFFNNRSIEEITEGIKSTVRQLFQFDVSSPPSSEFQHREIPLRLEIILLDNGVNAAMEESMQNFRMIPASKEAIETSLKKSTVMTRSECCSICLEEMDVNAECNTMPCDHVFHHQCVVTWLQTSHVCPLCRYALPTHKN